MARSIPAKGGRRAGCTAELMDAARLRVHIRLDDPAAGFEGASCKEQASRHQHLHASEDNASASPGSASLHEGNQGLYGHPRAMLESWVVLQKRSRITVW